MLLLLVAIFGLLVPNGIFLHWLVYDFDGLSPVMQNKLAIAFILDCVLVLGLLSYYFAVRPIGRVKWYWFVLLSLIGGLGFSIPFYWWLNKREA